MRDFRPPSDNRLFVEMMKVMFPLVLHTKLESAEIRFVGDGLARLRLLKGKRAMLCPNHSHRHDPEVMFEVSRQSGEIFNFVAAREVFDWNRGLNGWFLQQNGAYSVVRGAVDPKSFKMTKTILVQGKRKLVLFPEGEISRHNDALMPLESGPVKLAFMALDELRKSQPQESIYILPVAIKYTYKEDQTKKLLEVLSKIEAAIGVTADAGATMQQRVRGVSLSVLKELELRYGYVFAGPPDDINLRARQLKDRVLRSIADGLDLAEIDGGAHLEQVRFLRNKMDDFIYAESKSMSPYKEMLHAEKAGKIRHLYKDLDRIVRFIAIYDGYLAPPISQERMINVIELLESEIFGSVAVKGPRLILVNIGAPINLANHLVEYHARKKAVVEDVTREVSLQITQMLAETEKHRAPVFVSYSR